jgi:hypothetical protein
MSLTPKEMENLDIRSQEWLIDPIPFTENPVKDKEIFQILMSNPEILKLFISGLGGGLSNHQVRESANNSAKWLTVINKYKDENGELREKYELMKASRMAILHWLNNRRSKRLFLVQ